MDDKDTISALEEMYGSVSEETAYKIKEAIEEARGPTNLMDRFRRALMLADFDFHIHDEEKGESWKEADLSHLLTQLMVHAKKIGIPYGSCVVNTKTGHLHAIKVVNYALIIATRIAGAEVGDKVGKNWVLPEYGPKVTPEAELDYSMTEEEQMADVASQIIEAVTRPKEGTEQPPEVEPKAKWKGQNITLVSAYSGVTRIRPNENIIEKEPLESEDDE